MNENKSVKSVELKTSNPQKKLKKVKQFLGKCCKCQKETNYCPWINGTKYYLCSKCYRTWIAIKAKYYQLAVGEFLLEKPKSENHV